MFGRINTRPRRRNSHRADAFKRCEPFLKWLRGRECFIAQHSKGHVCQGKVRSCHFDPWGDKGAGSKVSDCAALPMCDGAHIEQSDVLAWPDFQTKYDFDGSEVVQTYWSDWLHTEMGRAWRNKNPNHPMLEGGRS